MSKKDKNKLEASDGKLTHSPFAALGGKDIALAPSLEPGVPVAPVAKPAAAGAKSRGRLVLRRETKHRGGKAVIVVRGFEALAAFDGAAIEQLAKQLKQALGCGGTVETEAGKPEIVLQGDRAAKVAELLRAQGFRVDGVTS